MDELPSLLAAGEVVAGKYRVERVLGRGGMGVVVAAEHLELKETFAIKCLLPSAAADPDATERFVREARAAVRLKSEHVARVYDVGRLAGGEPFMVMEYLHGQDLGRIVADGGPLSLTDAATYVLQACDAIAEAHALGIVHRDLKPSNLFLTRRPNGSACVKVLDFGISKISDATDALVNLTHTAASFGTPLYMSPEQMRSAKNVDARTDIWSLGVILYELTTGQLPFSGDTVTEVCARVFHDLPTPPSALRSDLPAELDSIVLRCLAKNPDERPPTVQELIHSLAPFSGLAVSLASTALAPLSVPQTRDSTTLAGGSASTLGPVIPGTSSSRSRRVAYAVGALGLASALVAGAVFVHRGSFVARDGAEPIADAAPSSVAAATTAPEPATGSSIDQPVPVASATKLELDAGRTPLRAAGESLRGPPRPSRSADAPLPADTGPRKEGLY